MSRGAHIPERRSAARHKVRLTVETDHGAGITRDVSLHGLFLVTDYPLSPGERLQLRLALPDRGNPTPLWVAGWGSVVRVESTGGAVGAAIAIQEEGLHPLAATTEAREPR